MTKVKEVMEKEFKTLKSHETIKEAIKTLTEIPESALPVLDKQKNIIGELSQKDLLLKIIGKKEMTGEDLDFNDIKDLLSSKDKTIDSLMERHEITANPDDNIEDIIKTMYDEEISTVPVIKDKKVIGIITDISILKHYKRFMNE